MNKIKLGDGEQWVLDYLKGCHKGEWVSPTEIGYAFGGEGYHSAWASPKCLNLVKKGLLERDKRGWYRLKPQPIGKRKIAWRES